jgi:hypothetical protein
MQMRLTSSLEPGFRSATSGNGLVAQRGLGQSELRASQRGPEMD